MAKAYNRAHVLGRLTAYNRGEATWHLVNWTRQQQRSAPVTRHYAVIIVDSTGGELERIEITTQSYTALRRLIHEQSQLLALGHTEGIEYEPKQQILATKKKARELIAQEEYLTNMLEQNVEYVQNTPGIPLSLVDAYGSEASSMLRRMKGQVSLQEQIQQVGPPLFQASLDEISLTLSRLETAIGEAKDFCESFPVPQPVAGCDTNNHKQKYTITAEQTRHFLDDEERITLPPGLQFPNNTSHKNLKPVNAAYLCLLEGFHSLVWNTAWEQGLYERLDKLDVGQLPKAVATFTKTEVMYLRFLQRHYTDPKSIDDKFLEWLRGYVSVKFLKCELLCYLAQL